MLKYENRHLWRSAAAGTMLHWPSDDPTQAVMAILSTVPVVVHGVTLDADGVVQGEPFLVGMAQPGHTPVKVRHSSGLALIFTFAKGGDVWLYNEQEPHQQVAPVGVSFVSMEKPGHVMDDPMQVIIHRDNTRKILERQAGIGRESREQELTERLARMESLLEAMKQQEASRETPPDDQGEAEQGAE